MIKKRFWLLIIAVFLLSTPIIAVSQMRTVKGKVLDETLKPVPGASVGTNDFQYHTVTDKTGYYLLEIPIKYDTVQIQFIGLETELVFLTSESTVVANRILLDYVHDRDGYVLSPRLLRRQQREEAKRKAELYKKASKLF